MTTSIKTQGTVITWNALTVGEVNSISGLSSPSTKIPIPSFADTVMKYRPGRRKSGNFVFGVNFNPDNATQAAIEADILTGVARTVTIVAPEGTIKTLTFTARASNFTITGDNGTVWTGELTLKITSTIVRS